MELKFWKSHDLHLDLRFDFNCRIVHGDNSSSHLKLRASIVILVTTFGLSKQEALRVDSRQGGDIRIIRDPHQTGSCGGRNWC